MTWGVSMRRRTFLGLVSAGAVVRPSFAENVLFEYLRIIPVRSKGRIAAIELELRTSPKVVGLRHAQIQKFRIEAGDFSTSALQSNENAFSSMNTSGQAYFEITNLRWAKYKESSSSNKKYEIREPNFDRNGFVNINATPVCKVINADFLGIGSKASSRYEVSFKFSFNKSSRQWFVTPECNFFHIADSGPVSLTFKPVQLIDFFSGQRAARLTIGKEHIKGTFSRLVGMDVSASSDSWLSFGPEDTLIVDGSVGPSNRKWTFWLQGRRNSRDYSILEGRFRFRSIKYWMENSGESSSRPYAVLSSFVQAPSEQTWSGYSSTRLMLDLAHTEEESENANVEFSVLEPEGQKGSLRRQSRIKVSTGGNVRLEVEHGGRTIFAAQRANDQDLQVSIQAESQVSGLPRRVECHVSWKTTDKSLGATVFSVGIGEVGIVPEGSKLAFVLGAKAIEKFRFDSVLCDLPVRLAEEDTQNEDQNRADNSTVPPPPGAPTGPVFSTLSWPVSKARPPIKFELRDVPLADQPNLPPLADGEKEIDRPVNRMLLDWHTEHGPGEAIEVLDVGLEDAELRVRRPADNLHLVFGFFNFRLRQAGARPELIIRPKKGAELSQVLNQAPDRPILSVTVPGGHVLKEAFAETLVTPADYPPFDMAAVFEAAEGEQKHELKKKLERLRYADVAERATLRQELQDQWLEILKTENSKKAEEFIEFQNRLKAEIDSVNNGLKADHSPLHRAWVRLWHVTTKGMFKAPEIPADQAVYLGPDFFDRDVYSIAELIAETQPPFLAARLKTRLLKVETTGEVQRARQNELKARGLLGKTLTKEQGRQVELAIADAKMRVDPFFALYSKFHAKTRKSVFAGANREGLLGHTHLEEFYLAYRSVTFPEVARSRHGGASRLCLFWDLTSEQTDAADYSLTRLLDWGGAELSVPRRAQRLFEIDDQNRRRELIDDAATLRHQGILPNPVGTIASRMAEVYANARGEIEPYETSLALLSRLSFSVAQDAALERIHPAPLSFYDQDGETDDVAGVPIWTVSIGTEAPKPALKAITSPDFRPEVFLSLAMEGHPQQKKLQSYFLPPTRGDEAPWYRQRPKFVDGQLFLPDPSDRPDDWKFRAAISPYVRHALVEQSVYGRPGIGALPLDPQDVVNSGGTAPRNGSGSASPELDESINAAAFLAPEGFGLVDVKTTDTVGDQTVNVLQTILRPQVLNFSEVTLTPMGPSMSLDATMQLQAPALRNDNQRAYPTTSVQAVRSEITLGEDERTSVVEKGYLFPLGNKAIRVISTQPEVIRPERADRRNEPAAYEIQRTWIAVTEPEKSLWYGQPLAGREWPVERLEILDKRTPDLVAPDEDPLLRYEGQGATAPQSSSEMVLPSGRIDLGPGSEGLVFWPRIGADEEFTFQFEVQFEGSPDTVMVPLIFVDFQAMISARTMQRVADYYNSITAFTGTGANKKPDPASLRVISHNQARRRYARELKDGDSSYETLYWVLGAEGRLTNSDDASAPDTFTDLDQALKKGRDLRSARVTALQEQHDNFVYGPLLAQTDQPPFYPFLQMAQLRLDRIARQTGARLGPVVEATFEKSYLKRKKGDDQKPSALRLPNEMTPDVVLAIRKPARLEVKARGDRVGAIGRPAGDLVGLARREGPFFLGRETELIKTLKNLVRDPVVPLSFTEHLSPPPDAGGQEVRLKRGREVRVASSSNEWLRSLLVPAQVSVSGGGCSGDLGEIIKSLLGDEDMLLLGFIKLSDLICGIAATFADSIPTIKETVEVGRDLVDDAVDTIQKNVLGPLTEVVAEIEQRFEDAAQLGGLTSRSGIDLIDVYPEVNGNLEDLKSALRVSATAQTSAFYNSLNSVRVSAYALIKALDDVARDPISPLQDQLQEKFRSQFLNTEFIEKVDGLFEDIATGAADALQALNKLDQDALQVVKQQLEIKAASLGGLIFTPAARPDAGARSFFEDTAIGETSDALKTYVTESAELAVREVFGPSKTVSELSVRLHDGVDWETYRRGRLDALRALLDDAAGQAQIKLTDQGERILRPYLDAFKFLDDKISKVAKDIQDAKAELKTYLEQEKAALEVELQQQQALLLRQIFGVSTTELMSAVQTVNAALEKAKSGKPKDILKGANDVFRLVDRLYYQGNLQAEVNAITDEFVKAAEGKATTLIQDSTGLILEALCVYQEVTNLLVSGVKNFSSIELNLGDLAAKFEVLATKDRNKEESDEAKTAEKAYERALQDLKSALLITVGREKLDLSQFPLEMTNQIRKAEATINEATKTLANSAEMGLQQAAKRIDMALDGYRRQALSSVSALFRAVMQLSKATDLTDIGVEDLCPVTYRKQQNLLKISLEGKLALQLSAMRNYADRVVALTQELSRSIDRFVDILGFNLTALLEEISGALTDLTETERGALDTWLAELKSESGEQLQQIENEIRIASLRAMGEAVNTLLLATVAARGEIADELLTHISAIRDTRKSTMARAEEAIRKAADRVRDPLKDLPVLAPLSEAVTAIEYDFTAAVTLDQKAQNALRELSQLALEIRELQPKNVIKVNELLVRAKAAPRLVKDSLGLPEVPDSEARLRDARDAVLSRALAMVGEVVSAGEEELANTFSEAAGQLKKEVENALVEAAAEGLNLVVTPVATGLTTTYGFFEDSRNNALKTLKSDSAKTLLNIAALLLGTPDPLRLLVAIDPRNKSALEIATRKKEILDAAKQSNAPEDKLYFEKKALERLSQPVTEDNFVTWSRDLQEIVALLNGVSYVASPLQIAQTISGAFESLVRADISALLNFSDIRALIEKQVSRLIPTRISTELDYSTEIQPFGGFFFPEGDRKFTISGRTSIDVFSQSAFEAQTTATLSPFKVWLLGESFDAFTIYFSRARFVTGVGQKPDFDVRFVDYAIGQQLEFIQELAAQLGQGGDGLFLQPAPGGPGVEVGYRLNLPAISFGSVTFLNVGLTAGAVLPFDKRRAIFSVGVSSRRDPFIMIAGIFGGGGHFTLYTSGEKLVGMDASFVGAAGGGLTAGVLTLQARVSLGVYIRKFGELTEIAGDFFAGGTGSIAFFSISTSLTVTTGQDPYGNMVGSAVFSYSFSIKFAKFKFRVVLYRQEGKGFSGTDSVSSLRRPYEVRYAGREVDSCEVEPPGSASLRISVPRKDDDFLAWTNNFAAAPGLFSNLTEDFGTVKHGSL
ncbi:hypothetical protein HEP89_19775 [Labrenzia sp. 5N]|uniref:hypothetical protein n=1 Tax=Labrenzia sp. 5N TaxID=2723402 RepID=UPI001447365A|nr:hypothetical protein [Labrenzia sp. 5N]NKX66371.1 hypothetical protein [Labrenzia sp. 5N]